MSRPCSLSLKAEMMAWSTEACQTSANCTLCRELTLSGTATVPGRTWRATVLAMTVQPLPPDICWMTAARLATVGARRGARTPASASSSRTR